MESITFPIRIPALRVEQPLGEFYITRLSASVLLALTYSDPLRVRDYGKSGLWYWLKGSQRVESQKRLKDIGRYIDTVEAAFPNSIILAANYDENGTLVDDESIRWRVEPGAEQGIEWLVIPTGQKLASIIDGQHRLHGFNFSTTHKMMELLCSVYIDLPTPYQAYVFATINFNQKKVDRSLAYELFGFNVEDEPKDAWSPEKLAVFLCRRLNLEERSPLHQHIVVAAANDEVLFKHRHKEVRWVVSTATIVDGILRLISTNPKKDKDAMHRKPASGRNRRMLDEDGSPLRTLFLECKDDKIFQVIVDYFDVVQSLFFFPASDSSYIFRTVGIQALFDILRLILQERKASTVRKKDFEAVLHHAAHIDFSDSFFQASGLGRTRIRNSIGLASGLVKESDVKEIGQYQRFIRAR